MIESHVSARVLTSGFISNRLYDAMSHHSEDLLRRYQQGDRTAAQEIHDRYVSRLLHLVRGRIAAKLRPRFDAEDVVQSAYRSFFHRAAQEEYVLRRAGDLWRLLASIAVHKLYGQVERHIAEKRNIDREEANSVRCEDRRNGPFGGDPTPDEAAALLELVQKAIESFPSATRQALVFRLQGRTIEEIANDLECSQRTVRRLLQQAKHDIEMSTIYS